MNKFLDIAGQRFGRLVAMERAGADRAGNSFWHCQCDCGHRTSVRLSSLREGLTISCGCARRSRKPPSPARLPQPVPYGYRWSDTAGILIDEAAAARIRRIDQLAQARLPQRLIAQAMNDEYPRADGTSWKIAQIMRVLNNCHLYRGGRRGKSQDRWPAILEPVDPAAS